MKRAAVFLLAVLGAVALAQSTTAYSRATTHALTGSAPTLDTDGADLTNAMGYDVVVSAENTRTLSTVGSGLLCYYLGAVATGSGAAATKRWMRCPTSLDCTNFPTGGRDGPCGSFTTPVGFGRVSYVPSAVTVSGGSTVDVTITVRRRLQQ